MHEHFIISASTLLWLRAGFLPLDSVPERVGFILEAKMPFGYLQDRKREKMVAFPYGLCYHDN